MKKYKIGIVGYGGFGQFLRSNWDRLEQVHVTAICDQDDRVKVSEIPVYRSLEQLLNSDVEIVSIATPPSTHIDLAMKAIRAGKHVLIEKPMALSTDGIQEILDEAERFGVQVSTNYMLRFNPVVRTAKRLTDSGLLGDLLYVKVVNIAQDESLPAGHWFWDKSVSGGILIEHAVHFFDLVYFISGQRASGINGFSAWRNDRQEDRVLGTVRHEDGLLASHFHAFCRPGFMEETRIEFVFPYGTIRLDGWIPLKATYGGLWNEEVRNILLILPEYRITEGLAIGSGVDESRPEGWGDRGLSVGSYHDLSVFESSVRMELSLSTSKSEVYGDCVRASLMDLLGKIEGEGQSVIDVEAMKEAVRIAEEASAKSED